MTFALFAYRFTLLLALVWAGWVFYRNWESAQTPQEKDSAMLKWLDLIKVLAPAILATVPGIPPAVIPAVVSGITVAEGIPGSNGAAKKVAVLQEVAIALQATNAVRPGTIDAQATVAAVSNGIDAAVNAINAIHSVNQKTA